MKSLLLTLINDSGLLWNGLLETLYMVSISMLISALFGIPLVV